MTTVVTSGVFNALAFAGAGYLFNSGENQREIKRHDLAMEKLTQAREIWYQNEVLKKDEIAQKRRELMDSRVDMKSVNSALDALRKIRFENRTFTRRPELRDFYSPSKEMSHYQHFVVGATGLAFGLLIGPLSL